MQYRGTGTRLAFLVVMAALAFQVAPAGAEAASPGSARQAHPSAVAVARACHDRLAVAGAGLTGMAAGRMALATADALVERPFEWPPCDVTLTLSDGTGPVPAAGPTAVRRLRE